MAAGRALKQLVDEYRARCLWFLRSDYYPATDEETQRVLGYIERYGDREAFLRVAEIRRWLSRTSARRLPPHSSIRGALPQIG